MANYTQHYHLHQWEPEDSFLRTDFNGDLSAIDAALLGLERDKCRAAIGRYTGDGELSYTVSLGARPKLAVVDNTSSFSSGYELGLDGMNERSVIITEDGFRVNGSPHGPEPGGDAVPLLCVPVDKENPRAQRPGGFAYPYWKVTPVVSMVTV